MNRINTLVELYEYLDKATHEINDLESIRNTVRRPKA